MVRSESQAKVVEKTLRELIEKGKIAASDKLPSLKEVAKKFNVSESTAYRAFSKLEQKGYVTIVPGSGTYANHISVVEKKRLRSNCISLVIANMDGFYPEEITKGLETTLSQQGYYLTIFNSLNNYDLERENLQKALEIQSKGIVIFPVTMSAPFRSNYEMFLEIRKRKCPLLFIDNYPLGMEVDYVTGNDFQGMYDLAKYLITMGHKKIAYISGPTHISSLRERQRGFYQAMNDSGLDVDPRLVFPNANTPLHDSKTISAFSMSDAVVFLQGILDNNDRPTALIDSYLSILQLKECDKKNLRVPDDLSVTSISMEWPVFLEPWVFNQRTVLVNGKTPIDMTCCEQPAVSLGKTAGDVILEKIKEDSSTFKNVLIDEVLHIGNSVKGIGKSIQTSRGKTTAKT